MHFLSWATVGAFTPFIVIFLMARNISTVSIGIILMLNSVATLVGQPIWGMLSDKFRSIKKVYLFCITVSTVLILLLPLIKNEAGIFIFMPLISFFFCCVGPLLDSWTIHSTKNSGKSYGAYRLWGSIGYSVISIIIGKLINFAFVNIIFVVYAILSIITLVAITLFYQYKDEEDGIMKRVLSIKDLQVGRLAKNYYYMTFVVLACIMYITWNSFYNFLPALIKQVGGDDGLYGIAQAVSAFSEVPILLFSSRLAKKFKPQVLILFGMLVFVLRLFLYSIAWSPDIIIFVQAFNGLSFAMFLSGSIYYIDSLTPPELKATAQTVAPAVYGGLSGIIGNAMSGKLIEMYGIPFVCRTGGMIAAAVFILFLGTLLLGKYLKIPRHTS